MRQQYLLYIDILGFTELVATPAAVDDLYRRIASLFAHRHPDFATIVFSDTVLVHCPADLTNDRDREYVVMFLCEFAGDLLSRLISRDVAFRAVITYGGFEHYVLNNVPCFFGPALINAYHAEKRIKATGLFIDAESNRFNRIYETAPLDDQWNFVFLARHLAKVDHLSNPWPLPDDLIIEEELGWHLGPEVLHLQEVHSSATTHPVAEVRAKYQRTWDFYAKRYPRATATLLESSFRLETLNRNFPWQTLRDRISAEDYSWASKRKEIEPLP